MNWLHADSCKPCSDRDTTFDQVYLAPLEKATVWLRPTKKREEEQFRVAAQGNKGKRGMQE